MYLSNLAVDRSITVFVLLLLIILSGVYSYVVLPRESSPEVIIPLINVTVTYEGVAPSDMETLVTVPVERKLTGISGVKQITSISAEGVSHTQIEFEPDVDIDSALQKVRDKVDQAKQDLPDDADDPVINELNIAELPIMMVSITGDVGLAELSTIAEAMEDELEAIRGVLKVDVYGDIEREIQIEVDPDRVAAYAVPLSRLVMLAGVENVNTPSGSLELGEAKYLMRVPGEFRSPDELTGLVVKKGETGVVYLRDLATIRDGYKEPTSISRLNGQQSVTLAISKRAGENIIGIAGSVKELVEVWRHKVPSGVALAITMDSSIEIEDMVGELENNILSGLILVLIVIFLFMGFTNAIMVALAIPLSMLITFGVIHMMGLTLNMVVLFSLILALGMLVDNGIVVVENIYRHVQSGMPAVQAAKVGAGEVALPVIAACLTTVAAFFPMFFWPGIWGSFMVFLPKTVTVALLASLFVGLVVNPALASILMRGQPRPTSPAAPVPPKQRRHRVLRTYECLLRLALRWRMVTITAAVTGLVVIAGVFFSDAEIEFVPTTDPRAAFIDVECPEGTNLDTTDAIIRDVEALMAPYQDNVEFLIANSGSRGVNVMGDGVSGGQTTHVGRVTLDFLPLAECSLRPSEIVSQIRRSFDEIVGAEVRVEEPAMGPPTGPPINIEISGEDFPTLAALAQEVREVIKHVPGLVDLRDDYDRGKPEIRVEVDREQSLLAGLNTEYIGLAVKAAINGRKAADYREGDKEYDVIVRFPRAFREDLANIEAMHLINELGQAIPFSAVAHLEHGAGLGTIKRIDRRRTVSVSAEVHGRRPPEVLRDVQAALRGYTLPAGYTIGFTGENEDQKETEAFLAKAFVAALLLITLVLVTQFNSIVQPLIILSSVVLSLAGVFLGLKLFHMPFGILMTGIGCISLAGVVVNNAIVLLDFINRRRAAGVAVTEAIVDAAMTRFRPVLLTAITTILGLIPMALGISFNFRTGAWIISGESSQWWGPMAVAIIFGLSFATVLTLIVVPVLYSLSVAVERAFAPEDAGIEETA
jgi:multidrug efflux pump